MANRIEQARAAVDACIREAYLRAVAAGELPEGAEIRGSVEQPKDAANGDFAANHAMASAKTMHMAPRKIAEALIAHMELGGSWFSGVEAAGPGCIPNLPINYQGMNFLPFFHSVFAISTNLLTYRTYRQPGGTAYPRVRVRPSPARTRLCANTAPDACGRPALFAVDSVRQAQ